MRKILVLVFIGISLSCNALGFYNVRDYGAKGDGQNVDSDAVNRAIAEATKNGGGTIFFPAGTYLSYSIRLQSNITLYFDAGATLLAAYPEKDRGYDLPEENPHNKFQDFGHSHWKNSLIWGIKLKNVTIKGDGLINGRGLTRESSQLPGVGNKAIALKECTNVKIKDISMIHCGHFAVLATGIDNLVLDNLIVDTNRDGFDIDACKNVRVSNCTVNAPWDDAIVLKSSYGHGYFKDTENVTITNCFVSGYDRGTVYNGTYKREEPQAPDQGFVTGRIKMGTESSGGFKNIAISNCVFEHCRGLALETVDGGHLEDVVITNITMRDIVNSPLFLRLGSRLRSPKGTPVGVMRRITISNINVYNADSRYASIISGIPNHNIEDVTLNNIRIYYQGGGTKEDALLVPEEKESSYPEPWMFGTIPASGFFLRHVDNIEMNNVEVRFMKSDYRPLLWMDAIDNCRIINFRGDRIKNVEPYMQTNVSNVSIFMSDFE